MFSLTLRMLRKEKGMTQQMLADSLHVSKGAVGMWELGKREPDHDTLAKIADLFNVSVDQLIGMPPAKKTLHYPLDLQLFAERPHASLQEAYDKACPEIQYAVRKLLDLI